MPMTNRTEPKLGIKDYVNALRSWRMISVLLMGFASGLPIALCSSTLQAWFTTAGIGVVAIGALSLVGQPYVYKFLWAPFLDRYVPPFLGRRRGWILVMQFALAIVIALMALQNPDLHPAILAGLALLTAFLSASQDIAIDAYRTDLLHPHERGLGAAMVTGGYRIAMIVSGGAALIIAAKLGWRVTYFIMSALMLLEIITTLASPELEVMAKPPSTLFKAVVEPWREFIIRPGALLILAFIVLYKLPDAFALSLGTPFLIRDLGFSLEDVGSIYKVVGIGATILGAFVGGITMIRMRMLSALLFFGIAQGASILLFVALAVVGKNYLLLVAAVFLENFCGGLATVAFVAFLMSLCDYRYTAAQFALLSALSAIGRVFVGPLAGVLVEHIGWTEFYVMSTLMALPGLFLLWWLRNHRSIQSPQETMLSQHTP